MGLLGVYYAIICNCFTCTVAHTYVQFEPIGMYMYHGFGITKLSLYVIYYQRVLLANCVVCFVDSCAVLDMEKQHIWFGLYLVVFFRVPGNDRLGL